MNELDQGVILDVTPGNHERFERHLLEGSGHEVRVCHGPDDSHPCPLLEEGACEEVDKAHGVVFKLDLDSDEHRRILAAYKQTIPDDMPIAVAVLPGQEVSYSDLLEGLYVWTSTPNAAQLDGFAALVEAADYGRPDAES